MRRPGSAAGGRGRRRADRRGRPCRAAGHGEEDIFPDPMTRPLADGWRGGVAKALKRENAALMRLPSAAA